MCDETNRIGDSETTDRTESTAAGHTTVRRNWQQSDQPSVMVVEAVAAATNRPMTELPPLQGTLDADALDTLLDGQPSPVTVSFRYADTTVSVNGNGSMEIHVDGDPGAEGNR
ncbi:HalOD1 output domain-containing protein [Haloarchaeobius salinus]|uniref:HalOD1 output domain-containing protein n=1 Tax=Haloarchaeobius salinus TaxID=1198298 RepID=UPI00210A922D|nr:HalOD1 output domain-containing protein [Haloarchaeobius salinus]